MQAMPSQDTKQATSPMTSAKFVFLAAVCLLSSAASGNAGTVALFATREAGQVVVDLAGVELSQREGVDLLDRSRIEQVLTEQKLTALGDQSDPLLLGQLLGVEMFIVWDQPGEMPEGRLVMFDGATGIRLDDRHIRERDAALIAKTVALLVDAALEKQQLIRSAQLRLISLTSLRNVNLPPQMQERAEQFVAQLEQSITQHPQCGLLERARLRYVVREKSLPIAQKQAHLLGAAHTVTVELSQRDAKQFTVKLVVPQGRQTQPRVIEEKITFDGGQVDNQAATLLAERLSQIPVDQALALSKEEQRKFEIEALMREASRLMATRQSLEAATRFEAAYALGDESLFVITPLLISLQQGLWEMSLSYESHGPGSALEVPPEKWFEIADIANYRLDVILKYHERSRHNPGWPFHQESTVTRASLTPEFDLGSTLTRANFLTRIDPSKLPSQYAALQSAHLRSYQVLLDMATEARHQLQGEDLIRFDRNFSVIQLHLIGNLISKHFDPQWPERFLEVFSDNLQHEQWLKGATSLATMVNLLPIPQRDLLLSRLDQIDDARLPAGSLAAQYITLYTNKVGNLQPSSELDPQCVLLAEKMELEFAKPDPTLLGGIQFSMPGLRIDIPVRRADLGRLLGATVQMISTPSLQRSTREAIFLRLLEKDVIQTEFLATICSQGTRGASPQTLKEAIKIVEAKDLSMPGVWKDVATILRKSERNSQTPIRNLPLESRHLPIPWQRLQEISLEEVGKRPTTVHFAQIHKGILYIVSSCEEPRGDLVILQIHRQSLSESKPPERLATQEFSREVVVAGSQNTAQLLKRPAWSVRFFSLISSESILGFSDTHCVVPTPSDGLYVLPIQGGSRIRFGTEEGLPSNFVQCAVPVGDKVFAWVGATGGEASFVSIDINTRQVQLIASCQREQKLTPLDNLAGAQFGLIPLSSESKSLMISILGARGNIFQSANARSNDEESRNGLWEFGIQESTFTQFPLPWDGDGRKYGLTVYGPDPISLQRFDTKTGKYKWFLFDSATRTPEEIPNTEGISIGDRPFYSSGSVRWWRSPISGIARRQDLATGMVTEFRVSIEGNTSVDKVMFYQNENTAIIQMGSRIWIARDFQLKPE